MVYDVTIDEPFATNAAGLHGAGLVSGRDVAVFR
jgi:hypothetical protein